MLTVLRYPTTSPITSACRAATGRSLLLHFARRWNPQVVYMPCYVPEGVIKPFKESGATIVFYKLDEQLRPDTDILALDLAMAVHGGARPVIVVIHYCGMVQPMGALREIADRYGAVLLSDCAHALLNSAAHTQFADVVLYSLSKFLPVADGAVIATTKLDLDLSVAEEALPEMHQEASAAFTAHLEFNRTIGLAQHGADISSVLESSAEAYEAYYKHIDGDMELKTQSARSRAIEARTNLATMRKVRERNSRILSDMMPPSLLVREDQDCQFAFPIRCCGKREEMIAALCEIGVLASSLSDKWEFIPLSGFEVEANFIDDHLLLPIGEQVSQESIITMVDALARVEL